MNVFSDNPHPVTSRELLHRRVPIGGWGECVARNHLIAQGLLVVRHAVFWLCNYRLVADLYDPPSHCVFEVKTTAKMFRPHSLPGIRSYLSLKEEGLAQRVVCIHVRTELSPGVSDLQKKILRSRV